MSFLSRRLQKGALQLSDFEDSQREWLTASFAKVCVRVDSEEELLKIYEKAVAAELEVHLITDSGKTEFHGIPTRICLAIGPADSEKTDKVTGHLKLL